MVAAGPEVAELLAQAAAAERAGDIPAMQRLGRQAADMFPDRAGAWFVLGVAQHRLAQPAAALASLRRARLLAPDEPAILHTLGLVAYAARQAKLAVDAFEALVARPGDTATDTLAQALVLLAQLLCDLGRPAEAERYARMAVAARPTGRDGQVALATALLAQRKFDEARHAIGEDPDDVDALLLLASALESDRQPEAAQKLYARVLQLDPDNARALVRQLDVALTLCEWQHYDRLVGAVLDRVRADVAADRGLAFDVFNLLALPVDSELILAASRAQAARHSRNAAPMPPRSVQRPSDGRVRIGYLLPYTDRHSLPQALVGIVERHDRTQFEVFGYSLRACDGSDFSRHFRARFDHVRDLGRGQATQSAASIQADGIDVLIDTTGHTGLNGLDVLAHRPAPVQAHYLGYGLTSGAAFVDYLITDRRFLGPDGEAHIAEAPVFLPHSFMATMRAPIALEAPDRRAEGLPETGVVFANFNHPCKIDPATFALWLGLLRDTPGSTLWLGDWASATRRHLRGVAAQHGVSPKRLVFATLAPHPVHLRRLALADIALDNRLHGGGVTTVDALWAGLPVVSLAGRTPAARLGASLLPAAGVPELVVDTEEAYRTLALALAGDPGRRAALRARLIAGRDTAPLFDTPRQARDLEAAYRRMWDRHLAGRPPAAIDLAGPSA